MTRLDCLGIKYARDKERGRVRRERERERERRMVVAERGGFTCCSFRCVLISAAFQRVIHPSGVI